MKLNCLLSNAADIEFFEEREKIADSLLSAGQSVRELRLYKTEGPVRSVAFSGKRLNDTAMKSCCRGEK